MTIYAAHRWRTNAELVADIAELYLDRTMQTVDVTYGLGKWWELWRPDNLVAHDIDPDKGDGVDYTALPEAAGTYDLAAFDPPYVAPGGRDTMGAATAAMSHAFGMTTSSTTPAGNQQHIEAGLAELYRVLKPSTRRNEPEVGIALVKVQDYVSSGRLFDAVFQTTAAAIGLGFIVLDRLELITSGGPQPTTNRDGSPRRQVHARRNHSTMLVLLKVDPGPSSAQLELV